MICLAWIVKNVLDSFVDVFSQQHVGAVGFRVLHFDREPCFQAFTLLGLRYLQRGSTQAGGVGMSAVAIGNLFASVAAAPFAFPLPVASASEWATIVYLGVCQIAVAYVFLTTAMRVLPALEVSLLLLIEPVLNPTWTWLIRGEDPGGYTIIGGAVIIAATAIKSVYEARTPLASDLIKTV